jgi:hypothetical protein
MICAKSGKIGSVALRRNQKYKSLQAERRTKGNQKISLDISTLDFWLSWLKAEVGISPFTAKIITCLALINHIYCCMQQV